jgi:hypothetical protein
MLFAYLFADHAHFDLTLEIADSGHHMPLPSGSHAKTCAKNLDSRAVLLPREAGAPMKEHHVDDTRPVQMLSGEICEFLTAGAFDRFQAKALLHRRNSVPPRALDNIREISQSVRIRPVREPF